MDPEPSVLVQADVGPVLAKRLVAPRSLPDVRIRELEWNDFPALVATYYALYDEVQTNPEIGITLFPERPSFGDEIDWFASLFRAVHERTAVAVIAEEDRHAVGHCVVRPNSGPESRHVGVVGLLVDRAWRARGIGRALLTEAIARSRGQFEILELSLFATNVHARRLYESLGFRTWGTLTNGIRRTGRYIDHEYMVLQLAAPVPPDAPAPR
jgi:ribosomal protein S18 acetylase RimI-like enzyme